MEKQNLVHCEKLFDKDKNLICDEFYYQFYENQEFNPVWFQGLKKVYDAKDTSGNYEIEDAIEYMDDDQEKMLEIINYLIGTEITNGVVDYIYVNYLINDDGSDNLIKQLMMVYEINQKHHLVLRVPLYSFSEYALNEFIQKIRKENK